MADIGFFEAPSAPAADPSAFMKQQEMAAALMRRGTAPAQGQMVGGHYVPPGAADYANQLVSALAGGARMGQLRAGAQRGAILNAANKSSDPIGFLGGALGGGDS
jgi:hypothetical protein